MSVDPPRPDVDSDDDTPRRSHNAPEGREGASPSPPIPSTETLRDAPTRAPKRIGHYHVKRVLAAGGMGTVYEATQEKPRRTVALKLMRQGIASRSALRRFEYESQILARLRHPGIAQVYEAGTHRDDSGTVPFFAMEYIVGAKPITQYVKEKKLGTRQRMELFAQVCDAVNHGHQKGIIHRDLKPSNILVDATGQVKIIDFGVARSTDSDLAVTTLQTDIGQLIGTLQYMSPEQCEADPHNIDTRSDVYALGVVFYELLCGKLPYNVTRVAMHEATRIIREQQPTKLSTLNKTLRGDVETIALKALEKDRERRYQSATDFGQDIHRYLSNEAIMARPPSIVYQLHIFARRNRGLLSAVTAVFLALLIGVIVSTAQWVKAERYGREAMESQRVAEQAWLAEAAQRQSAEAQRDRADAEADRSRLETHKAARITSFLQDMLASVDPMRAKGRDLTVREVLDAASDTLETELSDQPEVQVAISITIADTYNNLGLPRQAIPHVRRVLEFHRRTLGPEHELTLENMFWLASLHYLSDTSSREAIDLYRQLLEPARRQLGEDHTTTILAMGNLGNALRAQGEYAEAEPLLSEALALARQHLGEDDDTIAIAMTGMALLLRERGKHADANELYRQALKIFQEDSGVENPWTLRVANELADGLLLEERWKEAEELIRETASICRRILGDSHRETLHALNNLAIFGVEFADPKTAREYTELWLEGMRKAAESSGTDPTKWHNYALALLNCMPEDLRDRKAAGRAAENAVQMSEGQNPQMLATLAQVYAGAGDLDKAIETQERAFELVPWRHSDSIGSISDTLIGYYKEKGNLEAIERVHKVSIEKYRSVLTDLRKNSTGRRSDLASALIWLGLRLIGGGDCVEAESLLRECLEIRRNTLWASSWLIGNTMSHLGEAFRCQGKFEDAEPLLLAGYRQMLDDPQKRSWGYLRTLEALKCLRQFYRNRGKPDELLAFLEQVAARSSVSARLLNGHAWDLLMSETTDLRDPEAGLVMARHAVERSHGEDPGILDTLALAYFITGDTVKAVETQERAVSFLPPAESLRRTKLEANLAKYRAALSEQESAEPTDQRLPASTDMDDENSKTPDDPPGAGG